MTEEQKNPLDAEQEKIDRFVQQDMAMTDADNVKLQLIRMATFTGLAVVEDTEWLCSKLTELMDENKLLKKKCAESCSAMIKQALDTQKYLRGVSLRY